LEENKIAKEIYAEATSKIKSLKFRAALFRS